MSGWSMIEGRAVALAQANVDTDQLIPSRFMSQPRKDGYGEFLLYDARVDDADHPLNRHAQIDVLITRRNFGTGSSREAAVYALVDFGVRAVLAPSFGDIFAGNAVNNGLLPARIKTEEIEALINALGQADASARVDLDAGTVTVGDTTVTFDLDPVWRQKLMNGWDDIDLTAQHADAIRQFWAGRLAAHPWTKPTQ
ncbi:3-isopropylmalate dehydratase small subunit [uncultured Sulfitobacter sp.]|uniref:3-isopropylmalate dehydratase small subunit n=1 Tax=uncultured Sulfitobacter sp. TaxID=191468 RepID=UPI0026047DEE|nr:3-isopropylmalate dehydratase small subunit [uncultured Sulfitobacter sp.]